MYIRKAALICDKCGQRQDIDLPLGSPFLNSLTQVQSNYKDWLKVENNHLCPDCAKVYTQAKTDMEAKLKELAGIITL